MSTSSQEFLKSFDRLPEPEKREVASEIIRRAFAPNAVLDEAEMAALYAGISETDRKLAQEGIEDYERGLQVETRL